MAKKINFLPLIFWSSHLQLPKQISKLVFRYHQYSKLKRVKSYGDGIYHADRKETCSNDTHEQRHTLSSNTFSHVANSNCLSCQKQFTEEYSRRAHVPSLPRASNYETEEPSLSMLIWDQNQKSICPSYDQITVNNGSNMILNDGNWTVHITINMV